jgi:hypothetical protein
MTSELRIGLLVDGELGNLVKIDVSRHVVLAYHGFTQLSYEQMRAAYPDALPFTGDNTTRFTAHITSFDIPVCPSLPLSFAPIVTIVDGIGYCWRTGNAIICTSSTDGS